MICVCVGGCQRNNDAKLDQSLSPLYHCNLMHIGTEPAESHVLINCAW